MSRVLANLYAEDKQYAEASKLLQQLVEQSPRNAELHWNYGEALLHQHNYADAEAELIKALQLNSKLMDAYWERGIKRSFDPTKKLRWVVDVPGVQSFGFTG